MEILIKEKNESTIFKKGKQKTKSKCRRYSKLKIKKKNQISF